MNKCAYCKEKATTECAMGLPSCARHEHEADEYYQQRTGRSPNSDSFLFCPQHSDLWQVDCKRCETCCLYHYGCSVKQKFGDANTPEKRGVVIKEVKLQ